MNQVTTTQVLFPQRPFIASEEIIGFEKAALLLTVGCGCILLVFIFGFILCRLDMSSGKRHRYPGIYMD